MFEPSHLPAEFFHAGLLGTSVAVGLGDGVVDAGRRTDDQGTQDDAHGEDCADDDEGLRSKHGNRLRPVCAAVNMPKSSCDGEFAF